MCRVPLTHSPFVGRVCPAGDDGAAKEVRDKWSCCLVTLFPPLVGWEFLGTTGQLSIIGLVSFYLTNSQIGRRLIKQRFLAFFRI
uniref:Uncharacterized protein n=1 Tax=Brassica oleracea var. oleracea TaxID=109376 RepID=A0A0D2ZZ76_BRAOL